MTERASIFPLNPKSRQLGMAPRRRPSPAERRDLAKLRALSGDAMRDVNIYQAGRYRIDPGSRSPLACGMARRTILNVRRFLAIVVALSVAAMPAVSFAAAAQHALPAAKHVSSHAAMPDCHGMKADQPAPVEHEKENCPKCKTGVCTPDACQVKCSNAVGDLPRESKLALPAPVRLLFSASAQFDVIHLRPPLPPPRA